MECTNGIEEINRADASTAYLISMAALDRKTVKNAVMADIRFVETILRRWDPIGVEPGTFGPADEYNSYAPHIVSMVNSGCTVEELASHLEHLAVVNMGIGPRSASSRTHSLDSAAQIVGHLRQPRKSVKQPHAE